MFGTCKVARCFTASGALLTNCSLCLHYSFILGVLVGALGILAGRGSPSHPSVPGRGHNRRFRTEPRHTIVLSRYTVYGSTDPAARAPYRKTCNVIYRVRGTELDLASYLTVKEICHTLQRLHLKGNVLLNRTWREFPRGFSWQEVGKGLKCLANLQFILHV